MTENETSTELLRVRERYDRRLGADVSRIYVPTSEYNFAAGQERERGLVKVLRQAGQFPCGDKKVLEIGCGAGNNLLQLMRLGFSAENLMGNELLAERVLAARKNLPDLVEVVSGDARSLQIESRSLDIVFQSTVFSSILDDEFRSGLARRMWDWVKPGGGVLWYDFVMNNPRNPDVRGVPVAKVRDLFPSGSFLVERTTLAPPLGRRLVRRHWQYGVLNVRPLRTHAVIFIRKGNDQARR
jgi:SAM-dependent methyltransferase